MREVMDLVEDVDLCINVICKSGRRSEGGMALRIFGKLLEEK